MSEVVFNKIETTATVNGQKYSAELGTVIRTFFGTEPDHDRFSVLVEMHFGGTGQSTGHLSLTKWDKALDKAVPHPRGLEFLKAIMETIGGSWENLLQKKVWVLRDTDDHWGRIIGLVNVDSHQMALVFNDYWANPELDVK